ncbi:MAG: hypothetical protein MJ224_00150 [archaeon]|nr:hypothetical protein [archaeon]
MPSGSGTNPVDKKKKTEADKPEEQRDSEKKKRNNPKSETDKDEKDRNPHDPDVKKLKVTGYSVFNKDENKVSTIGLNDPRFAEISKIINPQKESSELSFGQISKEVDKKLVKKFKQIEAQRKNEKEKEKTEELREKEKSSALKLAGGLLQNVGEGIAKGFNIGQSMIRSR